jgi:hypothetical protein
MNLLFSFVPSFLLPSSFDRPFRTMSDTQMSYPKSVSLKKVTCQEFSSAVTHGK